MAISTIKEMAMHTSPDTTSPEGLLRQGQASRSALMVAALRAAHQLLDRPLVLDDPLALAILGPDLEAQVRADPGKYDAGMARLLRAAMVVRSRFAEDELSNAIARGVRQYVVLGAGLDTYAYRHRQRGLAVFEVDHPATQVWKRGLLERAAIAIPDSVHHVPVDFERDTLLESLRQAGCRLDQPVFMSWLGVTLYLSNEAIFDTLRQVASLPPGSAIAFDYGVAQEMLGPMERMGVAYLAAKFEAEGEPWRSFFAPDALAGRLRELGFAATADFGAGELSARYLAGRHDALRLGGATRLMLATV